MNGFSTDGAGDDLHGFFAPAADVHGATAGPPSGKKRAVPGKEMLGGEGLVRGAGGVKEQLHLVKEIVRRFLTFVERQTESAGDGAADGVRIKPQPFDGGGAYDVLRRAAGKERALVGVGEHEHGAEKASLRLSDGSERQKEGVRLPDKAGPGRALPEVGHGNWGR